MVTATILIIPLVSVETTGGIMVEKIVIMIKRKEVVSMEIILIVQSNQRLEDWAETIKVKGGYSKVLQKH